MIWATGYGVDFGWIDLAVTDAKGDAGPPQRHHPRVPGLYFLGLQWLSKMNSSFLSGRRRRRRACSPIIFWRGGDLVGGHGIWSRRDQGRHTRVGGVSGTPRPLQIDHCCLWNTGSRPPRCAIAHKAGDRHSLRRQKSADM